MSVMVRRRNHVLSLLLAIAALCAFNPSFAAAEENYITSADSRKIAQIQIEYASAAEAKEAAVTLAPLYANKELAVTTRWDDTNPNNLPMAKAMNAGGWRGTFYLVSPDKRYYETITNQLMAYGCGIGSHSMTHPALPTLNPNEIFRECLESRILLESNTNRPVTCFVTPSVAMTLWISKETMSGHILGEALRRSGYLGGPEFNLFPHRVYGLKESEWIGGRIITPGDKNTTVADFTEKFDAAVQKSLTEKDHLPIVIGVHAWQTPEAIQAYEACYRKYSGNSQWWYCEMNEYLAYRYQVMHSRLDEKGAEGAVRSCVLRYLPFRNLPSFPKLTLASSVPMKSIAINGQFCSLSEDRMSCNWGASETLIQKIDLAAPDGSSSKYENCTARLRVDMPLNLATLEIKNESTHDLYDMAVQLRIPPFWKRGIISQPIANLPAHNSQFITWDLGEQEEGVEYKEGDLYFAAQIDFITQGAFGRLYTTAVAEREFHPSDTPRDNAMLIGPLEENEQTVAFLRTMSGQPAPLHDAGCQINERWVVPHVGKRTTPIMVTLRSDIPAWTERRNEVCKENHSSLLGVALTVEAPETGTYRLFSRKDMKYIFLNGEEIKVSYEITLPLIQGRNNLIVAFPPTAQASQSLGVAKEGCDVRSLFLRVKKR